MRYLFRATAMLITAALLPGHAASAADGGTPSIPWRYATCVQGGLSGVLPDAHLDYFVVTGTATECAAPAATDMPAGFGLVTYRGRAGLPGLLHGYNVRVFPTPPATGWQPTPITFGALAVARSAGTYGVCLTAGPITRDPQMPLNYYGVKVACVRVTVTGSQAEGHSATMTPLAADDPLVSGPASPRGAYTGSPSPPVPDSTPGEDPHNFCGSCF
jgi:hypothetical protein